MSRAHDRRRNSAARTRSRNCAGVSVGGAGFRFTTAGAAASAALPPSPRAGPAVWLPSPSPRGRPFRQARHQGRCVGHGKARIGSRPPPFSNCQARRAYRKRPAHGRGGLAGDTHRQRANVLMLDRKRERPLLPQHRELVLGFRSRAAARSGMEMSCPLSRFVTRLHGTRADARAAARCCIGVRRAAPVFLGHISRMITFAVMLRAASRPAVVSWQLNANQFMRVPEGKLLAAMRCTERIVDVEHLNFARRH